MGQKAKNAGSKKSKVSNGKLATSYKHITGDFKRDIMETVINAWGDKRSRKCSNTVSKKDVRSMLG
jgi:hypothetical protein